MSGARLNNSLYLAIFMGVHVLLVMPLSKMPHYLDRKTETCSTYLSNFLASVEHPASSNTSGLHIDIDFGMEPNFSFYFCKSLKSTSIRSVGLD